MGTVPKLYLVINYDGFPNTRRPAKLVREIKCRTKRYEKSSLPYLAKLLYKQ